MRAIRFRGRNINTGDWVYGYFKKNANGDCYIEDEHGLAIIVDPESVGQYVRNDGMGNEVYEGDVVRYEYDSRYVETGKIARHVVERYKVVWEASNYVFLLKPITDDGVPLNPVYLEDMGMVKEVEE